MNSCFSGLARIAVSTTALASLVGGTSFYPSGTLSQDATSWTATVSSSISTAYCYDDDHVLATTPASQCTPSAATPVVAARSATSTPKAKKVFAHYMLGTVSQEHAQTDIDEAMAMGLDGFAFNIGDPSQSFVPISLSNLIGYAEYRGFSFYFSLDVYASGNSCFQGSPGACGGPSAYQALLSDYLGSSAWYKGPNGLPMISTYSSGGETKDTWEAWREAFAQQMYFIPDFDETLGYYEAAAGWWEYWGDVVDGLFSWEAAWPYRSGFGGQFPGDISADLPVLAALSPLQYKDAYGANVYRAGDLNLPTRMANILGMDESPDFIQVITWNDGPEGHYIGNLWYEQNNDTLPYRYANRIEWDHSGWQPLITSFINAWKNDQPYAAMAPPSGTPAIGAMWYKTIMQSSICPMSQNARIANYSLPPDGFDTGNDQLNYAVVLEPGATGYTLGAYSNGVELAPVDLVPGLNFGAFTGVQPGDQQMYLWQNGEVVLTAKGGRCVSAGCPDCIYNLNPQVVALAEDTGAVGTCPYAVCQKKVFAHYMVGNIEEAHAQTDIDNAVAMGLDGFALNVGDPTQNYVINTFQYMFDYTADNYPNFHLYVSMDLWAEGNAFNGVRIDEYYDLLAEYKGHPAYLQGPDGNSFISTFSSGGLQSDVWMAWRNTWADQVYLVPDFDDTAGYNTSDPGWWAYWGDVVQGSFSWESAWPVVGKTPTTDDITVDQAVVDGTFQHVKSYMIPLSPLQYKDSYDTNYFRGGNLNLPQRISSILKLNPSPDFVEYITWNDGPESHYMGNLWLEQNNDTQPGLYANSEAPHAGWQSLITSFIAAFKASLGPELMAPPAGTVAVGAMWYNSIMTETVCPNENLGGYDAKPDGFETAQDWLNFAIVVDSGTAGASLQAFSNGGQLAQTISVGPGLNYGYFDGISAGFQRMELVSADGTVLLVAAGGRCISSGCLDCIYNLNPVVVGFGPDTDAVGTCSGGCDSENGSGVVYVDPIIFVEPSPVQGCYPPCTFVMPPSTMPTLTTISFGPILTSIVVGGSTITTLSPAPITTSVISFWDMSISSGLSSFTFALTTSLKPDPLTIIAGGVSTIVTLPPVTAPYAVPEVVTISQTLYTVFGGMIQIGATQLSIPAATSAAQIVAVGGFFITVPASTATSTDVYTLPTTVYTFNGVTQTFSEAQFTDFATITAQTTITTTLAEVVSSGSSTSTSTTLVPFWLQVGGFYWSPVPLPTLGPFHFPNLPSFPPIPSPPCFKLFDIFSIDCPPDKSNPTTTFRSGPPTPTCVKGCGTLCTADCSSSETSSDSTCSQSTVTDYVVACSGTGNVACSTISSAVITGCSVTPTASTTGSYCVTGVSIDPEDQGDVAPASAVAALTYATVTLPESVVISNTAYTVTSGYIVVSQTTLPVPIIDGSATVLTLGGNIATVMPGYTGVVASVPDTSPTATTTSTQPDTTQLGDPACSPTSSGSWVSPSQASDAAAQFCNYAAGQTVTDGLSQDSTEGSVTVHSVLEKQDPTCSQYTVDLDTCNSAYSAIISGCAPKGEEFGGSVGVGDDCWAFGFQVHAS